MATLRPPMMLCRGAWAVLSLWMALAGLPTRSCGGELPGQNAAVSGTAGARGAAAETAETAAAAVRGLLAFTSSTKKAKKPPSGPPRAKIPPTVWKNVTLDLFDVGKFEATPVAYEPFRHLVVERFVPAEALARVNADFPALLTQHKHVDEGELESRGQIAGAFRSLLEQCRSLDFRKLVEAKFGVRLAKTRPRVSLRGVCDPVCNGKWHVDGKWKRVTYLLYLNEEPMKGTGGNLQLHSGNPKKTSMVPSYQGTLLVFLNSKNAWHGFDSYSGARRAIQVNYEVLDMIPPDMQEKTLDKLKIS